MIRLLIQFLIAFVLVTPVYLVVLTVKWMLDAADAASREEWE